jgi:hypothetical protein
MRGGTATDPMSQGLQGAAARRPSRRLRNRASFDNELPRSRSGRLERQVKLKKEV